MRLPTATSVRAIFRSSDINMELVMHFRDGSDHSICYYNGPRLEAHSLRTSNRRPSQ